jgi:hypothetical protein
MVADTIKDKGICGLDWPSLARPMTDSAPSNDLVQEYPNDFACLALQATLISSALCTLDNSSCIYKQDGSYDPNLSLQTISALGIYQSSSTIYEMCPSSSTGGRLLGPYFSPPREVYNVEYSPAAPSLALISRKTLRYDTFGNSVSISEYQNPGDASPYRESWSTYAVPNPSGLWMTAKICKGGLATLRGSS